MFFSNHRLIAALLLSAALHALIFVSYDSEPDSISMRSVIHARLDKQNRELVQQQQLGQLEQAEAETITEQSQLSEAAEALPQELEQQSHQQPLQTEQQLTSNHESEQKIRQSKEASEQTQAEQVTQELADPIQATEPQAANPQSHSQQQQLSQARVEAHSGSDDPTYTSYLRILSQYLGQRLKAKSGMQGVIRLKIKIQYGSIATSVKVIDSSGDPAVDDWAVKAALSANPYPEIPKELGNIFEFSPTFKLGQ